MTVKIEMMQAQSSSNPQASLNPRVLVIGAGPAGLMAADILAENGVEVHLYDSKASAGRKLLVAGSSGLNLTRSEPLELFLSHYGEHRKYIEPLLNNFGPQELVEWVHDLGIETFIGSSNKVFPQEMLAANFLYIWLQHLQNKGVQFHFNHTWQGWSGEGAYTFSSPAGEVQASASAVILALGGASWPQLGSTGEWANILQQQDIELTAFQPANCGFSVCWSEHFRNKFEGLPLKTVVLSFRDSRGWAFSQTGEFVITQYGVEGSLIYAVSALLRDELHTAGQASFFLDLLPDWTIQKIIERLSQPRGSRSISSHLQKAIGIQGVKAGLLWEYLPRATFEQPAQLAAALKALPIPVLAPRPLAEAISTAGGVCFSALNDSLMLKKLPGVFCAGEMLDWEAPTGGYLLTACFSSGHAAGLGALQWLQRKNSTTKGFL